MEEAFMTEFSNCSTLEEQVFVKLSSSSFNGFILFFAGCLVLQKPWNIWNGWGAPLPEKELEGWGRGKKGEVKITSISRYFSLGQRARKRVLPKGKKYWCSEAIQQVFRLLLKFKQIITGVFCQLQGRVLSCQFCLRIARQFCSRWADSQTVWRTLTKLWGWTTLRTSSIRLTETGKAWKLT